MKKSKSLLVLLLAVLTLSCVLTGCVESEVPLPIIFYHENIELLETNYYVGDELELNGQHIDYYPDLRDANVSEKDIPITTEMITGFSTKKAGEFIFKINYKGTSTDVSYNVYERPDLSVCYGLYESLLLDEGIVVEIKLNQIVIYYYEDGYAVDTEPTTTTIQNSTVKATIGGNPIIKFEYNGQKYAFANFANGIPTKLQLIIGDGSMASTCTKIK